MLETLKQIGELGLTCLFMVIGLVLNIAFGALCIVVALWFLGLI